MNIVITIPDSRIVDLFITACEGGSNYWCKAVTPLVNNGDCYKDMLQGFIVVDGETNKETKVTKNQIQGAMEAFPIELPKAFADFMSENDDATTADCFLQLCTFGEVIYG